MRKLARKRTKTGDRDTKQSDLTAVLASLEKAQYLLGSFVEESSLGIDQLRGINDTIRKAEKLFSTYNTFNADLSLLARRELSKYMGVVFVEGKASRNARLEAYYRVKALVIHLTKIA